MSTSSAPPSCAASTLWEIFAALPSRSPTTGSIWASARRRGGRGPAISPPTLPRRSVAQPRLGERAQGGVVRGIRAQQPPPGGRGHALDAGAAREDHLLARRRHLGVERAALV